MEKLGRKIVRFRIPIFIIGLLLLIPSVFGYINTRVNYDVLYYLPDSIETMQGQDILVDEFGTGAYSMFICEGMENKDVAKLKEQIEDVEHVSKVVWYDSFADISIPMEMLPEDIREVFNADDSTMMFIIFDTTTSADETMDAIVLQPARMAASAMASLPFQSSFSTIDDLLRQNFSTVMTESGQILAQLAQAMH